MFDKFPVLQLIALSKPRLDVCMFFSLFSAWPSVVVAVLHVPTGFQLPWPWGGIKKPCSLIKVFGSHFFFTKGSTLCRFQDLPNCQEEKTTPQSTQGNKRKMPWKNSRWPVCYYFLLPYDHNTPQNIFC